MDNTGNDKGQSLQDQSNSRAKDLRGNKSQAADISSSIIQSLNRVLNIYTNEKQRYTMRKAAQSD